jgi:transcriptional regulator with XRE-family HTH domain
MLEITTWTGRETRALRSAMRLSVDDFAEVVDVAPRTVSYWESNGSRTKPSAFSQSLLDGVHAKLDPPQQARFQTLLEEALSPPRTRQAATMLDPSILAGEPISGPSISVIRPSTIDQIHMAAETFSSWSHRAGSISAASAANAQMAWARSLVDAPCPSNLRREFHASLAHLGLVVGFINFDAQSHDAASAVFSFALQCAVEAGDPHLQVKLMSHQARQAVWCNRSESALVIVDRGLRLPDLTPTERAMLYSARARASAKLGRAVEARADVRCADRDFERSNLLSDRPWMRYYDESQHLGDTGHAMFDLAVEGQFIPETLERLESAVAGHTIDYARSKAMSLLKVACLLFAVGDPRRAVLLANDGLPNLNSISSGRVVTQLHELLQFSLGYAEETTVARLRTEIKELLL